MFTRYRTVLARSGAWRFSLTALVARLPDLDLDARHRPAGHRARSVLRPGRRALRVVHDRERVVVGGPGPPARPARPVASCSPSWPRCTPSGSSGSSPPSRPGGPSRSPSPQPSWPGRRTRRSARRSGPAGPTCSTGRPAEVQTAYALESVIDEVIFVIGPDRRHGPGHAVAPVGRARPAPGRGRARHARAGRPALARSRSAPARLTAVGRPARPCPGAGVILAAVVLALGSMFAAAEVSTVAFSAEQHAKPYAGVLLACWSAGSMLAGLVTGTLRWRTAPFRPCASAPRCWPW